MNTQWQAVLYVLIRAVFVVGALYSFFVTGDLETAGLVTIGLVLSFLPQLIERRFDVDLPIFYELVIVAFIFFSLFIGEFLDAYDNYWWWDKALHASSGIILGYVGFMALFVLKLTGRINVNPGVIAFLTFSVAMAAAGVWEIIEFGADSLFGLTMQHGLQDTMIDMILGGLGGAIAAGAAYWHYRWPDSSPLGNSLREFVRGNPKLKIAAKKRKVKL